MVRYRQRLEKPAGRVRRFKVKVEDVRRILARAQDEGRRSLSQDEALELIGAYGIRTPEYRIEESAAAAARTAKELGFPVVLKAVVPSSIHKTDLGLVATGLREEKEVKRAFGEIVENAHRGLGADASGGVLVQKMVSGGKETIMGMISDPHFGPLLMFGLGGIFVEVLKDVAFRVLPLTDVDARDMIENLRSYPILRGARGAEETDIDGLVEYLQRLAQLVTEHPAIDQLEINPLVAGRHMADFMAVDCRIILGGNS
jgi:acyl-CoA synthetase (NDP forming)